MSARADLNDGKPCFTYINPPGNGLRYVCTSTSGHAVEHSEPLQISRAWRTRITARREGEPTIYDRSFDSLSEPLGDPIIQGAFADARRLVVGTGFTPAAPALLSSSTAPVRDQPVAPYSSTITVGTYRLSSTAGPQATCVGSLGDLPQPPPSLPAAPCVPGATPVSLRPIDTSIQSPLEDLLDDTHTHTRTDHFQNALVTGEMTTAHYELVGKATVPCGPIRNCISETHHTAHVDSTPTVADAAWSTRITARLSDGSPVFEATVSSIGVFDDAAVRQALLDARESVVRVVGPETTVTGPVLISSARAPVSEAYVPAAARLTQSVSILRSNGHAAPSVCVGDVGEVDHEPTGFFVPPCPAAGRAVGLIWVSFGRFVSYESIESTHTHTLRSVYSGAFVTGDLTTAEYDFVAEPATTTSTLTVPIVLSPTGGSAFTSELTLTNLGPSDVRATFAYTPAFGGTSGVVTDTLSGSTQKIVPDAVAYLKGLGLSDPGAGGVLRMTFEGAAVPDVYAAVRTTAAVPEGRVGLAYPALPPSKLFSSPVLLAGLRQNALDRSNVAVLNAGAPADGDVTLRLTVSSGDPANPLSKVLPDVTLSPGAFSQISSILLSNGLALSNGTVRVERVAGTAPFYAYAVVNDQATVDGSFLEAIPANPASPVPSTTLPVVVETPSYSTELVLTNFSASPRTLAFTWVAPALSGGKATFPISLLPNEQQILPGFVQLLRDRGAVTNLPGPSFAGSLFVSDSTGDLRGVVVSARILSALGSGRTGVALPSTPSGSESTAPVWLCGLQQNAETRSNLALVNVGSVDSSPSDFRIDLYDGATGTKVASPVATVPAKGFTQIDRILATYAPGTAQGCALVSRTSGSNPFITYAVLNDGSTPDQRSGDGAFVASVPLSP